MAVQLQLLLCNISNKKTHCLSNNVFIYEIEKILV